MLFLSVAAKAAGGDANGPLWAYDVDSFPVVPLSPTALKKVEQDAWASQLAAMRAAAGDRTVEQVAGSVITFTNAQIHDMYAVPDWYPGDHSPMPEIVARGRQPDVFACGYCHLPDGLGRPENSGVAGLPADYIIQQMAEFRNGARGSAVPTRDSLARMRVIARRMTDDEARAAADYFSRLKPTRWIRVVESEDAPRTRVRNGMSIPVELGGTEPIGRRIVEVPEDLERTDRRDSHSGFIAYVPPGSIERGRLLVTTGGGGKTLQCAICHGPELRGLGLVPGIAGRSPSYLARQLFDFQGHFRAGQSSAIMYPVVVNLNQDDLIAIAAFVSSRDP